MPESKIAKAVRIGDEFAKKRVGNGILFRTNILFIIVLILLADDAYDGYIYHFQTFISSNNAFTLIEGWIHILGLPMAFLIALKTIMDIRKWESTYQKIRKLLG